MNHDDPESNDDGALAASFEAHRAHLHGVAYRMLGSPAEAEDAVQEAWLRVSRADASAVDNMGGWLTTIVARLCLDMLRSRDGRREERFDATVVDSLSNGHEPSPIDQELLLADSIGAALLVVLETLTPAERLAFVLHDLFAVPFDDIAAIVGRSVLATRQLASRARRRVQGASARAERDRARHRELVAAFLAASRENDFDALLAVLDPDVVLRADAAAVASGATATALGASAVASTFAGRARGARLALLDGAVGAVWAPGGRPRVAFEMTIRDDRIVAITLVADAEHLDHLECVMLRD